MTQTWKWKNNDAGILATGVDDPENPVAAIIPEGLDLFPRDPVPIHRFSGIHHERSTPARRELKLL